ncbi:MAG: hypothetical protein EOM90_11135 [Alphaproteobacteria bacterium]|nr:hypothetical protein [Alphaproteobacteria bacterium]
MLVFLFEGCVFLPLNIDPMKKHVYLMFLFFALCGMTRAQNFYVRLGVGVSGGISSNVDLLYSYSGNGSQRMISVVPLALGRGFTGVAAFGYKPSKYFGVELGISQFLGFPKEADSVISLPGAGATEATVAGTMLALNPAIVLSPGFRYINPYARIGFILGIRPTINATGEYRNASMNPPDESKAIRHFYGGVAVGLNAALGVTWKVSNNVGLFAEFAFSNLNYSPRYSEVTWYEKNGVDQLSSLTVKQKNTEYYSNIDPDEVIPDTSPDKQLRKNVPFSNAGVNIGVSFSF